ncbi:transcription elongation factor GreA [Dubosiella newyorkensis]|jgi:transcription elongation factor GreA|uniref:Transcription elongation factor GreA n=1 Tax=Dubosiella newyorkensis TaxID=1862672 RepID=A0A1U7NL53_9FIRM|nr:transcription elongation factor GreA [Dubosiella newyorkensis]MCI9040662.1 transcription elongation factor GreA [Dubosiella newyorkensis]OLU45330.1 transcription elongation factor GreA [Dubosiella newyorkensis]
MANEKFYVTQEGYDDLKRELDELVHTVRPQVIVELQEARAQGDLSENADYDAAREHQAQVEARIHEVEAILKQAEIIEEDESAKEIVRIGSVVTLKDLSDGEVATYTIVGTTEADPFEGKISNESPVVQAILDKKAGDVVTISKAAIPYDVEILEVK